MSPLYLNIVNQVQLTIFHNGVLYSPKLEAAPYSKDEVDDVIRKGMFNNGHIIINLLKTNNINDKIMLSFNLSNQFKLLENCYLIGKWENNRFILLDKNGTVYTILDGSQYNYKHQLNTQ